MKYEAHLRGKLALPLLQAFLFIAGPDTPLGAVAAYLPYTDKLFYWSGDNE